MSRVVPADAYQRPGWRLRQLWRVRAVWRQGDAATRLLMLCWFIVISFCCVVYALPCLQALDDAIETALKLVVSVPKEDLLVGSDALLLAAISVAVVVVVVVVPNP